ncbi:uncharacterized protein LOC121889001 [Thunnus maccoyii]|uniref:uncharacterized protein LOC121889001 n=1 Tax=Thunnus maccoyii TaxID=8240 RepID=UPI001C4DB038|nr:uncharacterized protein LOC121889001 [Thunnus maccoyii]
MDLYIYRPCKDGIIKRGCCCEPEVQKEELWISMCVLGEHHNATLGDPFTFSVSDYCMDSKKFTLTRRLKDDSEKAVGHFANDVWVPGEDYKDRVKHISNTSVVLTDITLNDDGMFEFTCGGRFVPVQLDVVVPCDVLGTEGETVKLPYYFTTFGEHDVEIIRWEKNNELVLELNLFSRKVTYGTGFGGRVSVSPDWFLRGDLSLKLERAQLEDKGVFFIHKKDKKRGKMGNPAAVRLKFKEKNSGQIAFTPLTASPPQNCTEEKAMGTWTTVLITAVVTTVIVVLLAGLFRWLKSRKTCGQSDERPATDVEMGLVNNRGPAGSQVNGVF